MSTLSVDAERRAASGVFGDPGSRRVVYDTTVPLPPASSPNRYSRWTNAKARKDPALVPAPGDRTGDVAVTPVEGAKVDGIPRLTPQPESASTVTQTALTAVATPVATSRAVETLAPKSINSYDPWPAYLWPVVECLIQRESGGVEWKVSPGGDVGLMQVGPANFDYLAERGITRAMLFDGPSNLRAGWMLYQYWQGVNGDGLTPWKSTRGGCS